MAFCTACAAPLDTSGRHPVCTGCGRTHFRDPKVGVGVVVHDDRGRLLLVQRSVGPGKGRWALPALWERVTVELARGGSDAGVIWAGVLAAQELSHRERASGDTAPTR